MELISQLKGEHVEIMRAFEIVHDGIRDGSLGDGALINELRTLKDVLVAHLDLEDKMLYTALASSESGEAKELGKKFSGEMAEISKVAMAFFGKYMSENVSDLEKSAEFRKELDGIIKAVAKRVDTEEKILYPAYVKCCGVKE
mgnify:CR=1 FL=1